jgi:arsenate reductase (thioredoxin)
MGKKKVLFICTHNSARSQMVEGLLRALRGDRYDVHSAGTEPAGVHPCAVKAMADIGIDIKNHRSKNVDEYKNEMFDYVITVCDTAREACPFFPGGEKNIHHSFRDPSTTTGDEDEMMESFRDVRDQTARWIEEEF